MERRGMKRKTDSVNHPAHYAEAPFVYRKPECIDITKWLSFSSGNACKYIYRSGLKGEDFNEDLDKALWYLNAETFCENHNGIFAYSVADMLKPADKNDEILALKITIIKDICVGGRPLDKIEQLRSMLTERSKGKDGKKASAKRKP